MMRTYTRKRPHHELINDVHELCRLCLNKAEEALPIFTDDPNNVCATLALRIMICVGLEVKKEECLPNVICTKCYNDLNKYYAFRKKCEMTYQKLKSHVLAFKENLYKEKLLKEAEEKKKLEEENEDEMKFVVTFEKDQFPDANVLNLNGVAQVNNFVDQQSLPDLTKVDSRAIEIKVIDDTEQQSQDGETYSPDITAFLSTMLLELGILTQQEDGLVYSNQNITSLELENGDGSLVQLQLMEEDDVEDLVLMIPTAGQSPFPNSTSNSPGMRPDGPDTVEHPQGQVQEEVTETTPSIPKEAPQGIPKEAPEPSQEKDIAVKYVTSNWTERCSRPKKVDKKGAGAWCKECGKRLATRSALTRHMRTHSGEKPYACATCGRSFAQKEVLLRHVLVHEEDRPHKCSVCDKSFTQRGALVSHARAHAPPNARPLALHRCDRCPKVFLYASGLSRHMMMHNGRVYVCGACERQFKDKSSLMRHLRNANHEPRDNSPT